MLKERFGYDDVNEEVVGHGVISFMLIQRLIERVVEKSGISFGEFMVLMHLRGAKGEMNLNQVKQGLIIFSGASITKVVEKLVNNGYVTRRVNPASRREKLIKATSAGRRLIERLVNGLKELNENVLEGFSPAEKSEMLVICARVLQNAIKASGKA